MTVEEELLPLAAAPRRTWRFDLVLPLFIRPRATLERIAAANRALWQTPLLLLLAAITGRSLVNGSITAANRSTDVALPPGFEFYTPEQMAQFQQTAAGTNNVTFNYILPTIGAVLGLLAVWIIISGLLHLGLTLFGGRGTSQATVNIVAWASLPLLLRFAVQIGAMLITDRALVSPGLAGFAPAGEGLLPALASSALSQIDIYLIWQTVLLVIGAKAVSQLPTGKCVAVVLFVTALVMLLRALPGVLMAQFSDLTVIQPFF